MGGTQASGESDRLRSQVESHGNVLASGDLSSPLTVWEGAFGLPPVMRTEVSGVPVFWAPVPGPTKVALVFRVGRAHEQLAWSGITHLVEHLALAALEPSDLPRNGRVEPARTVFFAQGSPDETTEFLCRLTASLNALPMDRLATEKQVLLTEAGARSSNMEGTLLGMRLGCTAYGLLSEREYGLHHLEADQVQAWAANRFCAANAAVWMTGPPAADLVLTLPAGERMEFPAMQVNVFRSPAALHPNQPRGVAFSGVIRRDVASTSLTRIAQRRLMDKLRQELGLSYQVSSDYLGLDATTAHVYLAADCLPEHSARVADAMISELEALARSGSTRAEIEQDAQGLKRALEDPNTIVGILNGIATRSLTEEASGLPDELLPKLEAVHPTEHASLMRSALDSAIWSVPKGSGKGLYDFPAWSTDQAQGKAFKPDHRGRKNIHPVRLTLGGQGVTYFHDERQWVTVRYDRCAALLRWDDGQRMLIGEDGFRIPIAPAQWRNGQSIVTAVDSNVGPETWVPMGLPANPQRVTPPRTRLWRRFAGPYGWVRVLLLLLLGMGALSRYFDASAAPVDPVTGLPTQSSDAGFNLLAGIVLLGLALLQILLIARRRSSRG